MKLLNSFPNAHIRHHHNRNVTKSSWPQNNTILNELMNLHQVLPFQLTNNSSATTTTKATDTLTVTVNNATITDTDTDTVADNMTMQSLERVERVKNFLHGFTEKEMKEMNQIQWNLSMTKLPKFFSENDGPGSVPVLPGPGSLPAMETFMNLTTSTSTTTTKIDESESLVYSIIIPLMLCFCILSSIINLVIVFSVRWCRKPMSPTLYFSISLALADAFTSIVLGTGLVVNSLLPIVYKVKNDNLCFPLALEAFRLGAILVAVTHLLALAINHWMGIVRPLQYEATMTRGTALRVIIIAWVCPISLLLMYFSSIPHQGFRSPNCEHHIFLSEKLFRRIFASFFFAPLILMTLIYWHIFLIVRNHLHYRLKYQSCLQLRRNVKAVVTTVLILGTYIVGWMPAILWYIIVCEDCVVPFSEVRIGVGLPVNIIVNILVILKAFVDPIIYAARMADIQAALKKMRYDFFLWLFESCAPPRSPQLERNEMGSVRFTKSFHMSSRGSSFRSNV